MSKYTKVIPLGEIGRIAVCPNPKRLTLAEAMAGEAAPPDIGINGGYYNPDWSPAVHLKAGGRVLAAEQDSGDWGYAWDSGADIKMIAVPPGGDTPYQNHITAKPLLTPWDGVDAPLAVGAALQGKRGWTALGISRGKLVIRVNSDGGDGITLRKLRQEMYDLGCETALALDGGQSVKYRDKDVYMTNPARPQVGNYIFIWLNKKPEEEGRPVGRKTVCLDPGHGPGCVNGSPDGTYKEQEFAWDMAGRVKAHLERCGVRVVLTRDAGGYPSLTERADASNRAGADLFVSLHSNAEGGSGWGSARGLLVYTSTGPETAARNVAAKGILARMKEAGVALQGGGLVYDSANGVKDVSVLWKATAPAVLVEYGFHTSREDVALLKSGDYRDKLAEATAKGVCDFLGVGWTGAPEPGEDTDIPGGKWGDESVQKAVRKGIVQGDGNSNINADQPITLRQWCVLADRLGLLDKE